MNSASWNIRKQLIEFFKSLFFIHYSPDFIQPRNQSRFDICWIPAFQLLAHIEFSNVTLNIFKRNWSRMEFYTLIFISNESMCKQECIPVEYVPPTCWLYPSMHCTGGVSQHALGRGCVSQHALGRGCLPREGQTDRRLWKHNLRKFRLRAIIK